MQLWIIVDGNKEGPLADFEVRRRILDGALDADTPAWHEGLSGWSRLGELAIFRREFEQKDVDEPETSAERVPVPPLPPHFDASQPSQTFWMRRFWARWFDFQLFAGLWWIFLYLAGADIGGVLRNLWLMLLIYLPWVPLEAVLLKRFGRTPGKALLGLAVGNLDGTRLSGQQAVRRSLRVYLMGVGMGWGVIALVCQAFAWFTVRTRGAALWDLAGGHRVMGGAIGPLRIAAFVLLAVLVAHLQWIVIAPHVIEEALKQYPELREVFEKNPPVHLPVRD